MPFDLNGSIGTGGNWTTVEDYSTFANHAEYSGTEAEMPRWNKTGGYNGFGAYEFDGVDDYLEIPDGVFERTLVLDIGRCRGEDCISHDKWTQDGIGP